MVVPEMKTTAVFKKTLMAYQSGKRLIVEQGGTWSSKTFSTLQVLILISITSPGPLIISVVSESVPHLRRGVIRDFEVIMGSSFNYELYNKTDHIYKFNNNTLEFFSADDSAKLRGGRRDILFINECNNISKESFEELDVRTRICSILDYNPTSDFWLFDILRSKGIIDFDKDGESEDAIFIHSTYLDAKSVLPESVIANIESRKDRDPNWWRVYGLGLVGQIEGLIHPNFSTVSEFPIEGGIVGYGLDFGYNDPAALIKCRLIGDVLCSEELLYESGLTNYDLDKKFKELGLQKQSSEIIADSEDPKSIEELYRLGWNIKPAPKGRDSVLAGIQKVNQYRQVWTERSLNGIKEQRNYLWDRDKDNKILETEKKSQFNHLMAARRYWLMYHTMGTKRVFRYNIGGEKSFTIDWNRSSGKMLHYAGISLMPDNSLYCLFSIWNKASETLYIYNSLKYGYVLPEKVGKDIVRIARLKYIMMNKIVCNEIFISSGKSVAALIKKHMRDSGATKFFSPATMFDMFGSIAYLNTLMNKNKLIIHKSLTDVASRIYGWSFKENENDLTEDGYCETLCLIASELKREVSSRQSQPQIPDYSPSQKKKEDVKSWQVA